ncbi:MAG: type II toxin-antitoxin system prevent-host-death family antitoxin [Candidatus Limnocylindrales bacterium]
MSDGQRPARVGIRELRQNLSVYVDRVKEGETLEVTEHGQPVAELRPLAPSTSVYDRLVAEGKLTPANKSLRTLPPPIAMEPGDEPLSETLRRMREKEHY